MIKLYIKLGYKINILYQFDNFVHNLIKIGIDFFWFVSNIISSKFYLIN